MDPPLSLESLKITETEEDKPLESKPELRTPVKSFFDLNVDAALDVLNRMDMSELFAFTAAFPDMEKLDHGKKRTEKCQLKLLRIDSSVLFGNFIWTFHLLAPWNRLKKKESNRTLGPLSLDVYQENYYHWQSEVEDTMSAALKLMNWILKRFPDTKFQYVDFLPYRADNVLEMPVMKMFKEEKISVPFFGEQNLENFFNDSLKRHQVVVLQREGTYKIAHLKTVENNPLSMIISEWFEGILCQHYIEVILLKNVNLKAENLHQIIEDWIELEAMEFLYLEARNLEGLVESEILSGFILEEWDAEEMEEFEENTVLQQYWQEQGRIIRNRNNEPASVHFNKETGTFVFVVWHTGVTNSLIDCVRHF